MGLCLENEGGILNVVFMGFGFLLSFCLVAVKMWVNL